MKALRFDFARATTRPRHPAMAWLLLALGALGAAMALVDHLDAQAQWQLAQQAVQRTAAAPRARPVASSAAPENTRSTDRARAALARPWGPLMRALEAHTPPAVALLSLDATGGTSGGSKLRLIGEARDVADAVAYVEALRSVPLVRGAELSHHERRESQGVALLRFSIDVDWGGALP
jgi:Tfp pilus assembly protein PilN